MRRQREQKGSLYKRGGFWVLRYRQTVNVGGELKTIQKAKQIAPVDANHKTKRSIEELVQKELSSVNTNNKTPERVTLLGEFVESVYLPFVQTHKRPSTYKGYKKDIWELHLKARCESALLRDVKTYDVQRWLEQIARQDGLSKNPIKHIKNFLSGVFRFAAQQDYFDSSRPNPVQLASIPDAPEGKETHAYSLEEIRAMLTLIPEPAATAVAVAAMTGIRASEIRGLEWPDYSKESASLSINRSRWRKFTTGPKTEKSKAPIPVIPLLAKILEAHRLREGNPTAGPIFCNGRGNPLCIDSLGQRVIRDIKGIEWHGWHGFRRGLASNLNRLGIDDSVIQAILRHSSVAVTQAHYIKTVKPDAVAAMQQFENALGNSLTFANCALEASKTSSHAVN